MFIIIRIVFSITIIFLIFISLNCFEDNLEPKWDFEELLIKPNSVERIFKKDNQEKSTFYSNNSFNFHDFSHTIGVEKTDFELNSSIDYYSKINQLKSFLRYKKQEFSATRFDYSNKPKLNYYNIDNQLLNNGLNFTNSIDLWNDNYFIESSLRIHEHIEIGLQKDNHHNLVGGNYLFGFHSHQFEIGFTYSKIFRPVASYYYDSDSYYFLAVSDYQISPYPFQNYYSQLQLNYDSKLPTNLQSILENRNKFVFGFILKNQIIKLTLENIQSENRYNSVWYIVACSIIKELKKLHKNRISVSYQYDFFSANINYQLGEIKNFESQIITEFSYTHKFGKSISLYSTFEYYRNFKIQDNLNDKYKLMIGVKYLGPINLDFSVGSFFE